MTASRILDRQGHSIALSRDVTVGGAAGREEVECLDAVFEGRATVSRPRPSEARLLDVDGTDSASACRRCSCWPQSGKRRTGSCCAWIPNAAGADFHAGFNVARFGLSGETFAFDATGLLLSR